MAREFRAICERERESSNFFGDRERPKLEARLSAGRNMLSDQPVLVQLAADAIRLGDLERASELITEAKAFGSGVSAQDSLQPRPEQNPREIKRLLLIEGMAYFLQAEDANCLAFSSAAACIFPIQPDAVHRSQDATKKAINAFEQMARLDPLDPEARWLLNLSHMLAGSYPQGVPPELLIAPQRFAPKEPSSPASAAFPRLINAAPALGVDVMDLAGGAVADDFDGDGNIDLVSSSWDPCKGLRAFRSNGVDGYQEVTDEWRLGAQLGGLNLIHGDVDNDGQLDLFVLRGAWGGERGRVRNSLLLNRTREGQGFIDVTYGSGLAHPAYPTQAGAFADYDRDGDLDLYIGNESPSASTDVLDFDVSGTRPFPSQLFENQGLRNGVPTFRDVARYAQVQNFGFAKGVAWGDIDNDGDEDLYVSNLGPNRLYVNSGDGTFIEQAEAWGVADASRNFATWFFDMDNDGDLDLFNADYSVPAAAVAASLVGQEVQVGQPRLYRNTGGRMEEVSRQMGFERPLLPMGANFGDLDGDGFEDIYLGTGLPSFTAVMPNVFYRNLSGTSFVDETYSSGLGHLQKGHAVAFADLDNDGDLDLYEQLGGAYPYDEFGNALYLNPLRNDPKFRGTGAAVEPGGAENRTAHRFVSLDLLGRHSNRSAIGARVQVIFTEDGKQRSIHRVVSAGGSFGDSSFRLELGLGHASSLDEIRVLWPAAKTSDNPAGSTLQTTQGTRLKLDTSYSWIEGEGLKPIKRSEIHFRARTSTSHQHPDVESAGPSHPSRDSELPPVRPRDPRSRNQH